LRRWTAEIDEWAGLAADRMAPVYLDAWARLNCQKPASVSEAEWRLALDDGGRFLDAWGNEAAEAEWTPGELFDVTAGLIWRVAGERVEAIGAEHVRLGDGRTIARGEPLKRFGSELETTDASKTQRRTARPGPSRPSSNRLLARSGGCPRLMRDAARGHCRSYRH